MVYDDIAELIVVVAHNLDSVVFRLFFVAHTAADETDNHVAGVNAERVVLQADTVSGGCLACYGAVVLVNLKLALEGDGSGHVKHNDTRIILSASPAKGAFRVAVLKGGYVKNLAAAAAGCPHSAAFGTGESAGLTVFLGLGDKEFGIIRGKVFIYGVCAGVYRSGIRFAGCCGLYGYPGRNLAVCDRLHGELVGGSLFKVFHLDVAVGGFACAHLRGALGNLPVIALGAFCGRPLESERSLFGLSVKLQAGGSRRSL